MLPACPALYTTTFLLATLATLLVAATLRLLTILPHTRSTPPPPRRRPGTLTRVLIVLGSGGHTHEMLALLRDLDPRRYTHRTWVVSSGDAFSASRAVAFETALAEKASRDTGEGKEEAGRWHVGPQYYTVVEIPRARRVHQSLLTTPVSAVHTLLRSLTLLYRSEGLPDLILTNGPGTACIVVLAVLVLKFFDLRGAQSRGKCKTVYVESFARVRGLSFSGKLVGRFVDRLVVQWEGLEGVSGGRAEYWGVLV
ncbi:Alg14-domain-containing protein [Bimuria novae-zelandiae CBS 107.79]|uniref:UDP-N-acetylglucosamine transferase subunit ALG14 n=1 Tax=Bimuria novae-zelandiae CBS 107.79 TaxID=1447943 RepID=A0A6A5VG10_9PLEO|nr:Alg14-domain-containing protein [Bimuria novae-zelandiae CBS 107.79]